jgi:hypothetical protein
MDGPNSQVDALLQDYLHRTERLRRFAWLFTALPLIVFVLLSVFVFKKGKEYLPAEAAQLTKTIHAQEVERTSLKRTNDVQKLAIGFVQQQTPAQLPKHSELCLLVTW